MWAFDNGYFIGILAINAKFAPKWNPKFWLVRFVLILIIEISVSITAKHPGAFSKDLEFHKRPGMNAATH